MSEVQIRSYCFEHAKTICGQAASIDEILGTAELILQFLTEDRSTLDTKH